MFVVYSKPQCGYCKRAKDHLDFLGEDYVELNIENDNFRQEMNERLGYEARTVPQIFRESDYIGGYDQLVKAF